MVAAKRRAGLVVDERPLALRAGLDVAAVPAQDDRRGAAPVDRRGSPGRPRPRSSAAERRRQAVRQQPAIALAKLLPEVDDLDVGPAARSGARAGRRAGTSRLAPRPTLSTAGVALPRIAAAPASSASRSAASRAWSRGVRSLLYVPSCSSSTIDHADVGQRRENRKARPDDDVDVAGPDPAPLVGPLAFAEPECSTATRASRSARSRSTSGIARAISGTRTRAGRPSSSDDAIASM